MFTKKVLPEVNHDSKQVLTLESSDLSNKIFKEIMNSKFNPGHGVICVFRGDDKKNYVLASPRINPESSTVQIQVAMGGRINASKVVLESLQDAINFKTNATQASPVLPNLKDNFNFSNNFFAFTHAEWDMCYLTFIAVSKNEYSLAQLRKIANDINQNGGKKFQYGIFDLAQILQLAAKTHNEDEKSKSYVNVTNYLSETIETRPGVVFDDMATHGLAAHLTAEEVQKLVPTQNPQSKNN